MVIRYQQNFQNLNYQLSFSNNLKQTNEEKEQKKMVMISYAEGASGVESTSGASGISGCSDSSGASGVSGVSGASGLSVLQQIEQIKNDLSRGNITIEEGIQKFKNLGIKPSVTESDNKTHISFKYNNKQYTITVVNGAYHYATALKETDVNHWKELQEAIIDMGLRETNCKGVYCQVHNPDMPVGNYTHQKHYVWNDATCEMVELQGLYKINDNGSNARGREGYEYVLAHHLRYKFTDTEGVYEKDGKNYKFDIQTQKFFEIQIINTDILFNDKTELTYSEFYQKIWKFLGTEDENASKFINLINQAFEKYGLDNNLYKQSNISAFDPNHDPEYFKSHINYDEEDLIKCIIMLMNKAAGIENGYPVTISKDTVDKLNEKGIYEELDKIVNGYTVTNDDGTTTKIDELRDLYYFGVDGYIDDFGQGKTMGDCWLLAAISALNATESGRQVIRDSIEKITNTDENGVEKEYIRVTFKGIGIYYDMSYEEMVEAREANAYSYGDNDVLALELATEKLRRDIAAGNVILAFGNGYNRNDSGKAGEGIYSGLQENMLYYLTGNISLLDKTIGYKSDNGKKNFYSYMKTIYDYFKTGNYAAYFNLYLDGMAHTTDGREFKWSERWGSHAYSIIGMTENTITIINPYYSNMPYEFTWDEFFNLSPGFIDITSTKLSTLNLISTLSEFEQKLQGDEFDKEVSKKELNLYFNKYIDLFIQDITSKYEYDEIYIGFIKGIMQSYLTDYISESRNENGNYNLKDMLNSIKIVQDFAKSYGTYIIISGQTDTINEILNSQEPILYDVTDYNKTFVLIYVLLNNILAGCDYKDDIKNIILSIYSNFGNLDLNNPNQSVTNSEYNFTIYSDMAQDYGLTKTEDGTFIDINRLINKILEIRDAFFIDNFDFEHFERKLESGYFDRDVNEIELNNYLQYYTNLLITDISHEFEDNDFIISILKNKTQDYILECKTSGRNEKGYFNLQEKLEKIKDYINTYLNAKDIVENLYCKYQRYIQANNIEDFQKQLFEYIAQNYGTNDDGSINLSNIPDTNNNGIWVDEFYQITQMFALKDAPVIDYNKSFRINSKNYTIQDCVLGIVSDTVYFYKNQLEYLRPYMIGYFNDILNVFQYVDRQTSINIFETLIEYYYNFVSASFVDDHTFYCGYQMVTIHNYITGEDETIPYYYKIAQEYGIEYYGQTVAIDITKFVQKFLELAQSAGLNIAQPKSIEGGGGGTSDVTLG